MNKKQSVKKQSDEDHPIEEADPNLDSEHTKMGENNDELDISMATNGIEQAISLGKIIMKKSTDPGHGYQHAKRVEESSVRIFREFKKDTPEKAKNITEDMVRIVALWHDAYKALRIKQKFSDIFTEGKKSAILAKKNLSVFLDEKQISLILYAIENHHKNIRFRLFLKKIPLMLRIILEADGLELVHKERFKKVLQQLGWSIHSIIHIMVYLMAIVFYRFYPMSQYGHSKYIRQRGQKLISVKTKDTQNEAGLYQKDE